MFEQYMTEHLYKIRNACDQIENPKFSFANGLCCYLMDATKYSSNLCCEIVNSVFEPTAKERIQFPGQGHAWFFSNYNQSKEVTDSDRIIAAGFLACLIDDELIARGE